MSLSRCFRTVVVFYPAVLLAATASAEEPPAPDPVQEFRTALLQPLGPGGPEARKAALQKRLDALGSAGDLAQVLTLEEFARQPMSQTMELEIRVDQQIRGLVLKKFLEQVRKALSADDAETRAAASTLLGATAVAERERLRNGPFNPPRFPILEDSPGPAAATDPFAELAPDLVKQTLDKEAAVQRAALRALVQVRAPAEQAMPALKHLLDPMKNDPSTRRAAAAALGELTAAAAQENERSLGLDPNQEAGCIQLEIQAVAVAALGLGDDDEEVRRHCLGIVRQGANSMNNLSEYPWSFGPMNDANPQQAALLKQFQEKRGQLRSLAKAVNEVLPAVAGALEDKPEAAVEASETLEAVAAARGQTRRWEAALPPDKAVDDKPSGDPLPALLDALPGLEKNLSRPEVRVQLGAIYVLETLGPEAAPAAAALVKALAEDANPFVRWGAVRALGKMAPARAREAVPALAQALADKNEDVRMTAAVALARFGPSAKSSVSDLASAVKRDDGVRLLALRALAAVGVDAADAASTVEAIAPALDDPAAEVRIAAVETLGHIHPLGDAALKALGKALEDSDGDVRRAASAALLRGK